MPIPQGTFHEGDTILVDVQDGQLTLTTAARSEGEVVEA
jgi:hypothetical protein